jgi:D-glycero-alpha-D-manno-heptose-7-phosphate kinase
MTVEAGNQKLPNLAAERTWRHASHNYNRAVQLVSSAPTRIDLAGDIWPLYLSHPGAQTLNAAISLRAHVRLESREEAGVHLKAEDIVASHDAASWCDLDGSGPVPLLELFARHYRLDRTTLTTRGESPAGAGIAGSSALAVALAGALARWTGASSEARDILEVAMNIECQTIRVPTGVQDYRPALYGGVAAIELGVGGVSRVALDVDPQELERRIVLAYTGAPRQSGTNNWEITKRHIDGDQHVFDCLERIRDTAAAMRDALSRGAWDAVGRHVAAEWDNRRRLAPGVSTPVIDRLVAKATRAGATAAKVCGAGGGGCLFCYAPPAARDAVAAVLAAEGARVLDYRIDMRGLAIES